MKLALSLVIASLMVYALMQTERRAGVELGHSQAYAAAVKSVQADMAKHCTCWFTGSKCRTPNPTVICTKPEWMK